MALNIATFKTRSLTAVIFVVVMVAGVLWNEWSFFALFSVVHFGCWIEYQKLVARIDPNYAKISLFHKYGVMFLGWGFMLYAAITPLIGTWVVLITLLCLMAEAIVSKNKDKKYLGHSFFGLLYISVTLALFVNLPARSPYGTFYNLADNYWLKFSCYFPCFTIACMWINDTMAYIVGSFIGKTPLSKISPKKTWEGTVGGIILCTIVAGYLGWLLQPIVFKPVFWWCGLALMAAIAGVLGDLLESKLKRLANVKDSGSIMPGHGGFLDRFDSLLLASPIVWAFIFVDVIL